jgi:integrase
MDTTTFETILRSSVSRRSKWDRKKNKKLSESVYVSRITYLTNNGQEVTKSKEFPTKRAAKDYIATKSDEIKREGPKAIDAESATFNDLADYYLETYVKEPEFDEGGRRRGTGLKSSRVVRIFVKTLRDAFGKERLRSITYSDLRQFRDARLKTPVVKRVRFLVPLSDAERKELGTKRRNRITYIERTTPRKTASVNRELAILRHMFTIARQDKKWLTKNPFSEGRPLISIADEEARTRILTSEEEAKLLEVCDSPERRHLKAVIICLLDTGVRLNEALTLTWKGVEFVGDEIGGVIHIEAKNTKTNKSRRVPISSRLRSELSVLLHHQRLASNYGDISDLRVFGIKNNVNTAWRTAKRLAGLDDLRLHDLRHSHGTRLDRLGFTQAQIALLLGHQQIRTTFRYTNHGDDLTVAAGLALDQMHARDVSQKAESTDMVH